MTVLPRTRTRALAALREGRVSVVYADAEFSGTVRAKVKGNAGRYDVTRETTGWRCTCAEWTLDGGCSHVYAVRLVTDLALAVKA